ncbi:hypothetical protein ACIBL6_47630 [Streptomyces sp. NPDC050400]|uniref:hypothetical protein n=1 Tax=Streptomyces sp. NPDC050400 TaxID=3365610 RepID=UPI0037AD7296
MAKKQPRLIGVLTEPAPPTWWAANRHRVFAVAGLTLGYLAGTHLQGTPAQEQPRPQPSHHTPAPATPHSTRTASSPD